MDATAHVAKGGDARGGVIPPSAVDSQHGRASLVEAGMIGCTSVVGLVDVRAVARVVDQKVFGVVRIHRKRLARLVELHDPIGHCLVDDGGDVDNALSVVGP